MSGQNVEPTSLLRRREGGVLAMQCNFRRLPLIFLISSFRRVQNVVCFLLGDSPASDLYMPTFRNTLSVPSSKAGVK